MVHCQGDTFSYLYHYQTDIQPSHYRKVNRKIGIFYSIT